jgi:DNA-3-methyladenine glycosylase II
MTDRAIIYRVDSPEIRALCEADSRLALLIRQYGDLSYRLHTDTFTFFAETIVGQMLSSKAADAIAARLYSLCGGELSVNAVLKQDVAALKGIGLSVFKTEYIFMVAELMKNDPGFFSALPDMPDSEVISRLTSLRGIGPWSAKMYLIFALGRLNVLPYEDGAFLQVYKWLYDTNDLKPSAIKKVCAPWSPYASLAARYLYRALDEGLTQAAALAVNLRKCE